MAKLAADVLAHFLCKILGKEGVLMMAMLWAQQIMFGKKTFAEVPAKLKSKVRELLIDSGCEDLVTED
jgi:hypothetical protein